MSRPTRDGPGEARGRTVMAVDVEDIQNETSEAVTEAISDKMAEVQELLTDAVTEQVKAKLADLVSEVLDHVKSESMDAIDAVEDGEDYAAEIVSDDEDIRENYPDPASLRDVIAAAYQAGREAAKGALEDPFDSAQRAL